MDNIQRTIDINDALNERIIILEEDIKRYEREIKVLINKNNAIKIRRKLYKSLFIFFTIISMLLMFMIILLSIVHFEVDKRRIIGYSALMLFLTIFSTFYFSSESRRYYEDYDTLNKLNAKLKELYHEAKIAKDKRREIVLLYEREVKLQRENDIMNEIGPEISETKECPMCAETIKVKARICRYCGFKFD